MKKAAMEIIVVLFLFTLLSTPVYADHSVTVTNKTGFKCTVSFFQRDLGTSLVRKDTLKDSESIKIGIPGGFCFAYLDMTCTNDVSYKAYQDLKGCLGTQNSKAQTCCWNTEWEIKYSAEKKQPVFVKTKP